MRIFVLLLWLGILFCRCSADLTEVRDEMAMPVVLIDQEDTLVMGVEVIEVTYTNTGDNYRFSVTLKSPDTGCEQYADWWEIITADSSLLQRRILTHSHVNEQPFTRSGANLQLDPNQELIIRGHMNNLSFGQIAMRGSIHAGFVPDTLPVRYAQALEDIPPLPNGCAF